MNINHTRLIGIVLLVLGMFLAQQALAEVIIDSVFPDSGSQGENLDVEISGSGFGANAEVTILLGKKPAPGITVQRKDNGSDPKKIVANIDIAVNAELGDYTLKVSLRRGGKGTTATATFKVVQGNKEVSYCDDVFFGGDEDDLVDCDCEFTSKVDGGAGKPNNLIWILQGDCHTDTTLQLPQYEVLNGNGMKLMARPGSDGNFHGSSVIANAGHRTHVFLLDIEVLGSVQNAGCPVAGSPVELESAISFVLDETKWHPEHPIYSTDFKEPYGDTYPTTWLRAWDITVTSDNPLCRAIELRRDASYNEIVLGGSVGDYTDLVAGVRNVLITSGSYIDAGIQVSGFVNSGLGGRSGENIGILFSTVEGAAPDSAGSAIRFGPVDGEGTVGQNVISANGDGEFGIKVEGAGMDDVTIENNNVVGAQTAIWADGQVVGAYFKSNVLTGDGLEGDPNIDIGIDTSACHNSYRSNTITKFDIDLQEGGCDLP